MAMNVPSFSFDARVLSNDWRETVYITIRLNNTEAKNLVCLFNNRVDGRIRIIWVLGTLRNKEINDLLIIITQL